MVQLRTDIWCSAYVRRQNDLGRICIIVRRGDPIAGQVFIEVDHLDGTASLFAPAPSLLYRDDSLGRLFECRLDRVPPQKIAERMAREADFDPDFWQISLETRSDPDLDLAPRSSTN